MFPAVVWLPHMNERAVSNTNLARYGCPKALPCPTIIHRTIQTSQPFIMATPEQQKQLQALSDEYTTLQNGMSIGFSIALNFCILLN